MLGIENGLKDFSMALVPEDKPEASEAPHPSSHKFAQAPLASAVIVATLHFVDVMFCLGCSPKTLWRSSRTLS